MWEKVILSVLFVTILGLQFANSLTCLSCDTLDSCLQPSQQVCNDATANASSLWLATMHADVPFIAHSDKFKCMNLTYAFNPSNIRTHEFLGCFHQLNISHSNTWYQNCHVCDWNLCNRNPAGTFSKSSFTILASILCLVLTAKMI